MKLLTRVLQLLACILLGDGAAAFCQSAAKWAQCSNEVVSSSMFQTFANNTGTAADNFGNVYLSGSYANCSVYFGSTMLPGDSSTSNAFIIKYDALGNVKWATNSLGEVEETRVATDKSGNVIATGPFFYPDLFFGATKIPYNHHGFSNYFLTKFDSSGNVLWAKGGNGLGHGGGGSYDVKTDKDGNIFFLGSFGTRTITFGTYTLTNVSPPSYYSTVSLGDTSYYSDIFLVKLDPNGNVLWAKAAGGTGADDSRKLAVNDAGCAYITGEFLSDSVQFDHVTLRRYAIYSPGIFIAKYGADGTVLWAKTIGSTGGCAANDIETDDHGNAYVTGIYNDSLLTDTLLLCVPPAHQNGFFAKFDPAGNLSWIKKIGEPGTASGVSLAFGRSTRNIYLSGDFYAPYNLDLGGVTLPQLDTFGGKTGFIAEYNDAGIPQCVIDFDLPDGRPLVTLDMRENIYISGTFIDDFFLPPSYNLHNTSYSSVFMARYDNCETDITPTFTRQLKKSAEVSLYPNPTKDYFTIQCPEQPDKNSRVEIYDATGRLLLAEPLQNNKTPISINNLSRGVYSCRIILNGALIVKKLTIE